MTLPAFDTIDQVPEPFRGAYEERDGKAVPKADLLGPGGATAIERMKAEEKAAKARARDLEAQLADAQRKVEAGAKGIGDDVIAKWNAEKAAELAAKDAEIAARQQELRSLKLDDKVKAAALEAGLFPKHAGHLLKLVGDRFGLSDEGSIIVKDEHGAPTPKSLGEFFAAHRTQYAELYQAPPASGGGAKPAKASAGAKIDRNDRKGFLANIDDIAAGNVVVS